MIHRNQTMTSFKAWIEAVRPKTLIVSICPIIVAASLSTPIEKHQQLVLLLALAASMLIQIGCNLANDYYDHKKGSDTSERLGPQRGLQHQLIKPSQMKWAFVFSLFTAFLSGLYLMIIGGLPIIAIGISGIMFAILYTATPFALAYTGLADIVAFLYFGPIPVSGTHYLLTGIWSLEATLLGGCLGAYAVAILTVNNLRDRIQDKKAKKKTLCVRFGRQFGETLYTISMLTPLSYGLIWSQKQLGQIGLLALLPCVLISIRLIKAIHQTSESDLNPYLGKTAGTLALFSLSISLITLL